jgi:glycosyltransferase involved in cell wall biosynthesis
MQNFKIVSCCYNTPELVANLAKSIKSGCENTYDFLVMNTSTDKECEVLFDMFAVNFYSNPGLSHGEGVNFAMKFADYDYMLLIDSDVIVHKDLKPAIDRFIDGGFALMGNVSGDRGGKSLYPRVDPWFCFMNLKQLKEHNIKFFDPIRTKRSKSESRVYDVGSTMFEDVMNAGLTVANVNLEGKYFKHYEGMSWRVQKYNPYNEDTDVDFGGTHDNRNLYLLGKKVQELYDRDTEELRMKLWI